MMNKIGSAVVALLLLSACPAWAQFANPRVSAFVGGSFPGGERVVGVSGSGSLSTDLTKGAKVGFRFGVDLTAPWSAEATYSFGSSDLRVIETSPNRETLFNTHLHQLMVNALYNFNLRDRAWKPFATVGLGLAIYSPTESAKELASGDFLTGPTRISTSTRPSFNFGGGIEREINGRVGVRADFRDHITGIPRFGLPEEPLNPGGAFYPVTGVVHDIGIDIGVVFHFGN